MENDPHPQEELVNVICVDIEGCKHYFDLQGAKQFLANLVVGIKDHEDKYGTK